MLDSLNHIHDWELSPLLSCSDTCEILTCYSISKQSFDNGKAKINNGMELIGLVTPTPGNPWINIGI